MHSISSFQSKQQQTTSTTTTTKKTDTIGYTTLFQQLFLIAVERGAMFELRACLECCVTTQRHHSTQLLPLMQQSQLHTTTTTTTTMNVYSTTTMFLYLRGNASVVVMNDVLI
jgi:hypothetical protein